MASADRGVRPGDGERIRCMFVVGMGKGELGDEGGCAVL